MATMVSLVCSICGKAFQRSVGEVRRTLARGRNSYCSFKCTGVAVGRRCRRERVSIEKTCPVCGDNFETIEGRHAATFCSRSCASKGSVTPARRAKARLSGTENSKLNFRTAKAQAASMRQREAWKNRRIADFLAGRGEEHVFEFPLRGFIFDLAFPQRKLLVEFDGPYHKGQKQLKADKRKDAVVRRAGWRVVRIETASGLINPECLRGVL